MGLKPYVLSFTSGALLHSSSLIVAQQYCLHKDWSLVKKNVIEENLLQARTQSTLKRIYAEIEKRLKQLTDQEIECFIEVSHQEQAYILWLAVCRFYTYIGDFAAEVLRNNFVTLKPQVTEEDYQVFYLRKSDEHFELTEITDQTARKVRQVLFLMMKEAGLIDHNNFILLALLSPALLEILAKNNFKEARYFPVLDADLHG